MEHRVIPEHGRRSPTDCYGILATQGLGSPHRRKGSNVSVVVYPLSETGFVDSLDQECIEAGFRAKGGLLGDYSVHLSEKPGPVQGRPTAGLIRPGRVSRLERLHRERAGCGRRGLLAEARPGRGLA